MVKVDGNQHITNGFSTNGCREAVFAIFFLGFEIFILAQQLMHLEWGEARLNHNIVFEIKNAFHILQRHVKQIGNARWHRLQEPDVRNWCCQINMAHAFAPHLGKGDFNAAFFADDALILHALIFAAQAFVILHWPKDTRAEQAITFWLESAVIDGFRLFDFAERP